MEFSRPESLSWEPFPFLEYLPTKGIKPRFPALQVDSLPAESQGKHKNTGVSSLSFFQRILPTQELGSPAFHADSLTTELSGKLHNENK